MAWDSEREAFVRKEASGVLAFRVVVMLSCLILVPAAAIFGSAFPELVQTQLVDRLKSLAELLPRGDAPPDAGPRLAAVPVDATNAAPAWNATEPAPTWQPAVTSQPHSATAHQVEYSEGELAAAPADGMPQPPRADGKNDYFTEIQQRLRDFGASYYALEAVGDRGELYRFTCTMADATGQAREFAATDRDPLRAMHRVMSDVEAGRGQAFAPANSFRR
jgi:hypothetical protein